MKKAGCRVWMAAALALVMVWGLAGCGPKVSLVDSTAAGSLPPGGGSAPAASESDAGAGGSSVAETDGESDWRWVQEPHLDYDVLEPIYDYYYSGTQFLAFVNVQQDGLWGTLKFDGEVLFEPADEYPLAVCGDDHVHGPAQLEARWDTDQAAVEAELAAAGLPAAIMGGHGAGGGFTYYHFADTGEFVLYGGGEGPPTPVRDWGGYEPELPAVVPYLPIPAGVTEEDLWEPDIPGMVWEYGLVRTGDMEIVLPAAYSHIERDRYGFYALLQDGKWGYYNIATQQLIADCVYDMTWESPNGYWQNVGFFNEGLCPVKRDGKVGFMDETGAEVIAPQFDGASHVYGGKAWVQQGGLWGQIEISN